MNETAIVEIPTFDKGSLIQGRGVWMQTCRAWHLMGIGGAPAVTDFAQWDVRLPKGGNTLANNVINGIASETGTYRMPPRGGNSRLADEQIRLAVGYKTWSGMVPHRVACTLRGGALALRLRVLTRAGYPCVLYD